ncbi:hypothetical protein [Virgibacillus doumboii]|uniref:hypothetical protein n=1 Tax=Virgibacillus doumboii TaxID=2697503 RepID=UPI0013DEE341|nr:hypothetical protein [Virgibacillus doumboii]
MNKKVGFSWSLNPLFDWRAGTSAEKEKYRQRTETTVEERKHQPERKNISPTAKTSTPQQKYQPDPPQHRQFSAPNATPYHHASHK